MTTAIKTPAPTTTESGELRACQCRDYADATTGDVLQCDGVTYRNFAVGHDARLKGHLIRIGRAGHKVRVKATGVVVSPTEAASLYGFAPQVAEGIRRVHGRSRTASAPGKPTDSGSPTQVARVGRWKYEGRVRRIDGARVFVYRDRRGNERRSRDFVMD